MLERTQGAGAALIGISLVWLVACGDEGASSPGSGATLGSADGAAVGTTGTSSGGTDASATTGNSGSGGGGPAGGTQASATGAVVSAGGGANSGGTTSGGGQPGAGGAAGSGGRGSGGPGSGGAGGDLVDCSAEACASDQVCVPDSPGCGVVLGRCFDMNEATCARGAVCGCDGVIYDNRCDAYVAGVAITELSECEQPDGTIACVDRLCDAETESCQVVNESRCDGACLALCPGRHTVTHGECIPALPDCDGAVCDCPTCLQAASCAEDDGGITLVCVSGCVG